MFRNLYYILFLIYLSLFKLYFPFILTRKRIRIKIKIIIKGLPRGILEVLGVDLSLLVSRRVPAFLIGRGGVGILKGGAGSNL